MKILHIIYSGLGGHGNVFFSMVDADSERNFAYEVIFFGVEDVRQEYIEKVEKRKIPWSFVKKKQGLDPGAYRSIKSIIKRSGAGIVFIHSSTYIFAAKWACIMSPKKIKIIVRETQANHLKTKQEWIGLSFALLIADKVVFLSPEYHAAVKKKLSLFHSNKRTVVIPNGIDLDVYKPIVKNVTGTINIGMQSRLIAIKDHATLLKAFRILIDKNAQGKKMHLFIAGDGDCRVALEKQAFELGLAEQVSFLGMLKEKDLAGFINSLDIYIHATLGETMSTAIMQVMACRLPIIASDVPGVNNMIRDKETGLLVPVQNENALAEAVLYLLDNPGFAEAIATKAFGFAQANYSNKIMLEKYKTVFNAE